MLKKVISKKWRKIASNFIGVPSGRHCHWCKHKVSKDGDVTCGNKASPFADGDRIHSWDGGKCARGCSVFELDQWYTDNDNYDKSFDNPHVAK